MNGKMLKIQLLVAAATLFAAVVSARTMPDGFVYRARCTPATSGEGPKTIDITLRLYETETSVLPNWTGVFASVPLVTNGLFQVWVSEAAHASSATGEARLEEVLQTGKAAWLGVTFAAGRECKPRRMLVTAPLANAAVLAETLDPSAVVGDLTGCESLVAGDATIATLTCDTLAFGDVSSGKFNLQKLNARSVTLYRDEGNRVLARSRGKWSEPTVLLPGAAITNELGRTAYLTIRSTDGSRTAPALTVPVPAGAAFVWQAAAATATWQFTALGAE